MYPHFSSEPYGFEYHEHSFGNFVSDVIHIITTEKIAKRKVIQVALRVMFSLMEEKSDKELTVKIGLLDEQKKNRFKEWWKVLP